MTHERTETGRALLRQQAAVKRWLDGNRYTALAADIEAAELLACELYYAACNGDTSRLLRRQSGIAHG